MFSCGAKSKSVASSVLVEYARHVHTTKESFLGQFVKTFIRNKSDIKRKSARINEDEMDGKLFRISPGIELVSSAMPCEREVGKRM